ncbi:hypothetical protein [Rhodoplanes sp. Z2-YC6860]|uniref:hypothetical protein n=1 Tax=Rhodoplanes sp. Z2-YC6860 TaxID=674703 RepID=UPI0012EE881D|nr:hypothetical protein [Rhodoplanes sp. Z2-YC6860]
MKIDWLCLKPNGADKFSLDLSWTLLRSMAFFTAPMDCREQRWEALTDWLIVVIAVVSVVLLLVLEVICSAQNQMAPPRKFGWHQL